jgi:hypothetical protein
MSNSIVAHNKITWTQNDPGMQNMELPVKGARGSFALGSLLSALPSLKALRNTDHRWPSF